MWNHKILALFLTVGAVLTLAQAPTKEKIEKLAPYYPTPQMVVEKMLQSWPRTKVVFISGFTDDPLLDRARLPGGVVFLQKPFTLESLLERVDQALKSAAN